MSSPAFALASQPVYLRAVTRLWQALSLILALVLAPVAMAEPLNTGPSHIAATLVAERAGVAGETIELAIAMRPAAGWHG